RAGRDDESARLRGLARDERAEGRYFGARLVLHQRAPEARHHRDEVIVVRVEVVPGLERHRQEELRLAAEPGEPGRQNSDDRVRLRVDPDAAADDRGIGAEPGTPQTVA